MATEPLFADEAGKIAMGMSQCSVKELERLLRVNPKIALQNFHRYQSFWGDESPSLQAVLAYTGIVFRHLSPGSFSEDDFRYAQGHLLMTSFCYGLLRPLDLIKNYRLEGSIALPGWGGISLFEYWKPFLTDTFIQAVKDAGGILVNLASEEMRLLFDWERVEREVFVLTPSFQVEKQGKLKTIVIYAKMSRGEMARFILRNRIEHPEELKSFSYEGFAFCPDRSDGHHYSFILSGQI